MSLRELACLLLMPLKHAGIKNMRKGVENRSLLGGSKYECF